MPDERDPAGDRRLDKRAVDDRGRSFPVWGGDGLAGEGPGFAGGDLHVCRRRFLGALATSPRDQPAIAECVLDHLEETGPPLWGGMEPREVPELLQPHEGTGRARMAR